MRVLLDTNTIITASIEGIGKLSRPTRELLEDPGTERLLSSISMAEIAIKVAIGKLKMNAEDTSKAAEFLRVEMIPYTPRHAQFLFRLPLYDAHRDPFDRMIIATAIAEDIPVVSRDREFKRYKGLRVIQ